MTFNFESLGDAPREDASLAGAPAQAADHATKARRRVLLVGQPNVGKSVIFGALTGTYVTVSNYPGTTVEVTRGVARIEGQGWEVVDTPGTHNLVPMSEDEAVTRDLVIGEPFDALVQVGDAKNLARTLLLTLQLAELGVPFCLDLNMIDEARARGISLDLAALARELPGVRVNASAAIDGEGVDELRGFIGASRAERLDGPASMPREGIARSPLACAPRFPDDVEQAIDAVRAELAPSASYCDRALATMLLAGERSVAEIGAQHCSAAAREVARERGAALTRAHGVPVFALLSRLRLARAQSIVRLVQRRAEAGTARATRSVAWPSAVVAAGSAALVGAMAYDGAVAQMTSASSSDPITSYGVLQVAARLFSARAVTGWTAPGLAALVLGAALGTVIVHRSARAQGGLWKIAAAFAAGWTAYFFASAAEAALRATYSALPLHVGAAVTIALLAWAAIAGDRHDGALSTAIGRAATHPVWGLGVLAAVLLVAYKVVGVFGAGTAVDFVENQVFGAVAASAPLDATTPPAPPDPGLDDGAQRIVVTASGPSRVDLVAETKQGGVFAPDPEARVDVYGKHLRVLRQAPGRLSVEGPLAGAEARIWTGHVNRAVYGLFAWIGVPLLTAFFVGPYGMITMGATYAVAIVLPVVATFFFVFSMLEDSGYLPRLAVMANRSLRGMGLNGRAVLPMVLGLGCDTMATLTARIMETRKERTLVTLLLALAIPCSSQLSVIFALMQRTSHAATAAWLAVVVATLIGVGWAAARLLPGDRSDFLLEMPPMRRPLVGNLAAKTMARIEWYLKEAVPLFLAGTALLFVLDAAHLLRFVHRAGEPIVHHVLGFPRSGGVADRVSEALLVGFLRRDFGAAGLLEMARAGRLSAADVAVSMVTITLFIPCIANVLMIVKERGWKAATMMSAFIFPYAVLVGAVVRLGFRVFGGG